MGFILALRRCSLCISTPRNTPLQDSLGMLSNYALNHRENRDNGQIRSRGRAEHFGILSLTSGFWCLVLARKLVNIGGGSGGGGGNDWKQSCISVLIFSVSRCVLVLACQVQLVWWQPEGSRFVYSYLVKYVQGSDLSRLEESRRWCGWIPFFLCPQPFPHLFPADLFRLSPGLVHPLPKSTLGSVFIVSIH